MIRKQYNTLIYNIQMSELEGIAKALIQVVGTLQSILSQKNVSPPTLQPDQPKLKKTPDMTYNQFVKKALSNRKPLEVPYKKSSYRLQEDLQLLSDLSNYNQISIKTFEQISKNKKLNRSTESLRSRYHDHLYKIDETEMKRIVAWVENQGVEGYLFWDAKQMKISKVDPAGKKDDPRKRPQGYDSQAKRQERLSKRPKNIPVNCKQLNEVLKLYSKMVNVPIRTLAEKLDQLSGDLVQLDNYIETKDARMLWTAEQDEILKRGGAEVEILKRYRGDGVEKRKKYLGLS